MKLILTRHGETIGNQNNILQGHLHGKLSKQGINQAKKLALRLKNENFDIIYSSDLARTLDTAKEIHKYHKKIELKITKQLREVDFGDWTGKKKDEVDLNFMPKNMETHKKIQNRIISFIEKLYKKHKNQTILIVTHYGCIVSYLSKLLERPVEKMLELEQENTAINIIEIKEDKSHILHLINCSKHLN